MAKLFLLLGVVVVVVASVSAAPVVEEQEGVIVQPLPDTQAEETFEPIDIPEDDVAETSMPGSETIMVEPEIESEIIDGQSEAELELEAIIPSVQSEVEPSKTNIEQLIEQADPIENDINEAITPTSSSTTTEVYNIDVTNEAIEKSLATEGTTAEVAESIDIEPEQDLVEEELEIELQENKPNTNSSVQEIIHEDILVIGEYPEGNIQEDFSEYQLVVGESENGNEVLSEFVGTTEEEEIKIMPGMPIVESVVHEYPSEIIQPSSVFRPEQSPAMLDYPEVNRFRDMMYDDMYDTTSMPSNTDYFDDYHNTQDVGFNQNMPDYPTDYDQFIPNMDYADDFPSTSFNEAAMYDDVQSSMPMDYPMYDTEGPNPATIVAGVNDNYHPAPMVGMMPVPVEVNMGHPDMDYPNYDDAIIPAGMVNMDIPAVEAAHFEDSLLNSPKPDLPARVEFPQPVAEFAVQQDPMASRVPTIFNDNLHLDVEGPGMNDITNDFITYPDVDQPSMNQDLEMNPPKEIVIKLDFTNEEAYVNGKLFPIQEPSNILGFIEKMLNVATMSARIPSDTYNSDNMSPRGYYYNSEMNRNTMYMENNSDYYPYEPAYYSSSYGSEPSYYNEPQYSDYYGNYDDNFPPMHPFLKELRERLLVSRMNALRSARNDRFGYDTSSRFQRSASPYPMNDDYWYNPYW